MFGEFARAFNNADQVFVTDIYAAGETPIEGVDSARLARAIHDHGHHDVNYVSNRAELASLLAEAAKPGDVVISLGAGDINRILPLIEREIVGRPDAG